MWDWDLLNENKALWLRSPSDVTEEEYLNFYKALAKVCPATPIRIAGAAVDGDSNTFCNRTLSMCTA